MMPLPASLPGRAVVTAIGFEQGIKADPGFSADDVPSFAGLLPADPEQGFAGVQAAVQGAEPAAGQTTEPVAEQTAEQPAEQPGEHIAGPEQAAEATLPAENQAVPAPNALPPEPEQTAHVPGPRPSEPARPGLLMMTAEPEAAAEKAPVQLWRLQQQALQPGAQYVPASGPAPFGVHKQAASFTNTLVLQRLSSTDSMPPASSALVTPLPAGSEGQPPALPFTAARVPSAVVHEWAPLQVPADKALLGQQLLHTLKDKVELQLTQQVQQARIKLDPPEMGRMELTVRVEGDRLHVQINASHAGIRDAITAQADRLRQDLQGQHGGGVEVNVDQQDSHSSPSAHAMNDDIPIGVAGEHHDDTAFRPESQGWFNALV